MSGKVVVHRAMSLDGFIAGPEHEMDWIFEHTAPGEGAEEAMAATGAMLSGRHTYDVGQRSRRRPGSKRPAGRTSRCSGPTSRCSASPGAWSTRSTCTSSRSCWAPACRWTVTSLRFRVRR